MDRTHVAVGVYQSLKGFVAEQLGERGLSGRRGCWLRGCWPRVRGLCGGGLRGRGLLGLHGLLRRLRGRLRGRLRFIIAAVDLDGHLGTAVNSTCVLFVAFVRRIVAFLSSLSKKHSH